MGVEWTDDEPRQPRHLSPEEKWYPMAPLPWWLHLLIGFLLGVAITYLALTPGAPS